MKRMFFLFGLAFLSLNSFFNVAIAEIEVFEFDDSQFNYFTPVEDYCAINGWYGDGICDQGCYYPDPDCEGENPGDGDQGGSSDDFCEANGWYNDGICDEDCPQPDPDCE